MTAVLFQPIEVNAQSMVDYTALPFSVPEVAAPNVLLLLDASGTIKKRAAMETNGGTWTETATYFGIFDSMKCYTYDSADSRFEASGAAKAAIDSACALNDWDGNFLNWISFRRYDAITVAMIGGVCIGGRNADGTCIPNGSPAKQTIAVQKIWNDSGNGHVSTASVATGVGVGNLNGRVPTSVQSPLQASSLVFHLRGGTSGMQGSFCTDDDGTEPAATATTCADSGAYPEKQFFMHVAVDSEPTGVVQEVGTKARFGLMLYSAQAHGFMAVPVGTRQTRDYLGTTVETFESNTAAMIDAVEEAYPQGGTPIRETLYGAMRYYAQVPTTYSKGFHTVAYSPAVALGASGTGSLGPGEINVLTGSETCPSGYITDACGRDPNFFGSDHTPPWAYPSAQVACCENYVILFWDGIPSGGGNPVPAALQDYGHSAHGAHTLADNVYTMVGIAHWANTKDLRQNTIPVINETGHDVSGFQNVTTYAFLAFGDADGRATMQEVAKYGGFEDSDQPGDAGYNEPDKVSEYDKVNNDTGAATPDGIPDTFFESNNAGEIKDKLTATFASILDRSSSGTSASVLATSATGEGAIYQAFFFSTESEGTKEIDWTGYTQGLFVDTFGNIREDTDGDGRLVYKNDKIVQTRFNSGTNEVVADLFVDVSPEDGKADSSTPAATVALKAIAPIWEAGRRLALTDPSARTIKTWVDQDNDGFVDAGEVIDFTTTNSTTLAPYLRAGTAPYTADNMINFIRGTQVTGLRDRQLTVKNDSGANVLKVWKYGDPVNSAPTVVGRPSERFDVIYGDNTYREFVTDHKDRRQVAYVGANDGMLHAFNAGFYHAGDDPNTSDIEHGYFTRTPTGNSSGKLLGEELWGFIPQELLPHLQWLARPDYTHVYYVDLKPKITDVRIFCDTGGGAPSPCVNGQASTTHTKGWGTILIGGMRLGGSCGNCTSTKGAPPMTIRANFGSGMQTRTFYSAYFVLDITNPEQEPVLLWSFTDADLGLSTSVPAVVRVNPSSSGKTDNSNAKWYMVLGSGPTGYDGSTTQTGKIFAIDIRTGPKNSSGTNLVTTFATGDTAFMGDMISLDSDLDYRVDALYLGNVFLNGADWIGKMYRLTTDDGSPTLGNWGIVSGTDRQPTVLLETFPATNTTKVGPVVAAPTVTMDDSGKIWVFFGTGRFLTAADMFDDDTQHFFGVKDPVVTGGCTEGTVTDCAQNDLVNVSSAKICVVGVGDCGQSGGTNQVTEVTGVTTFDGTGTTSLIGLVQSKDGWFTTLPATGERSLSAPTLIGGTVFLTTFSPLGDVCSGVGGDGFLYALFYLTGGAYSESVIGTETVGGNTNVLRSISLGAGLPSQMALHLGGQGSGASGTTSGSGCVGGLTGFIQTSSGALSQLCGKPALPSWSRYITWLSERM
ncbi:MAG: hypothetical protein O7E49_12480 [Gemmatimonadetes bacterium]|nr:hypothetical protein [Gemmatimonadota bacterium]